MCIIQVDERQYLNCDMIYGDWSVTHRQVLRNAIRETYDSERGSRRLAGGKEHDSVCRNVLAICANRFALFRSKERDCMNRFALLYPEKYLKFISIGGIGSHTSTGALDFLKLTRRGRPIQRMLQLSCDLPAVPSAFIELYDSKLSAAGVLAQTRGPNQGAPCVNELCFKFIKRSTKRNL